MKTSILSKAIYYYKILIIILSLVILATPQYTIFGKIGFIIVGLGGILCLWDLFSNRTFLKAKRMIWLILFLISFAITVVLNYKINLNLNVMSFAYSTVALILLYPNNSGSKEEVVKEMFHLNNVLLGMTAIMSTIGFVMFITLFEYRYNYAEGQDYIVGWSSSGNRLFGLYSNPGLMLTAIAIAFTFIQIEVSKHIYVDKTPRYFKIFIGYSLVINYICLLLENAKGAYISLAVFFAFYLFMKFRVKGLKDNLTTVKNWGRGILLGVLSTILLFSSIYVVRLGLPYLPKAYYYVESLITGENPENADKYDNIDIERGEIPDEYGSLTGRPQIWERGMEEFCKKPIFGWGPLSFNTIKVFEAPLRHLHNFIVESLAGVGIVGSFFIFFFLISALVELLRKSFSRKFADDKYSNVIYTCIAMLIMFAVNSMAEVTILYMTRLSVFLFWLYLGYTITLLDDGKPSRFDKPLLKLYNLLNRKKEIKTVNEE